MANPQVENGFTRISNELLEAIFKKVANSDYLRLICLIIRITYGFNRKKTKSHLKSFSTALNIAKDRMVVLLSELYLRKIIFYEQESKDFFWVELNKNYEEWHLEEYISK